MLEKHNTFGIKETQSLPQRRDSNVVNAEHQQWYNFGVYLLFIISITNICVMNILLYIIHIL